MATFENTSTVFGYDEVRDKILAGEMDVNTQYPGISDYDPTILEISINEQDTELFDYLLQHDVEVNRIIPYRNPAIYSAVNFDDMEYTEKLLNAGAICSPVQDQYGDTFDANNLLQLAIDRNNKEMVKLLLEKLDKYINPVSKIEAFQIPSDCNNPGLSFDQNPLLSMITDVDQNKIEVFKKMVSQNSFDLEYLLQLAIDYDRYEFVEYLIDIGADVNYDSNAPIFHIAIENENIPIIELLIRKGADTALIPEFRKPALAIACDKKNIKIIEILIAAGADATETFDVNNSLHCAIIQNNYERIENLAKNAADINNTVYFNKSPLILAIDEGNKPVVELLIKNGADINFVTEYGVTAIVAAIDNNNLELVEILMDAGADINNATGPLAPLKRAIYTNKHEIYKYLIKRGANVNGVIGDISPLQEAAQSGNKELVELLIKKGANVNHVTEFGRLALETVCDYNNLELAKILIDAGSDVIISLDHYAPLKSAIKLNNQELAEYLINHCINAEITCNFSAALICAVQENRKKIVELLIKNGANIDYTPKYGRSPLCSSIRNRSSEMTKVLIKAGADINLLSERCTPLIEAVRMKDYKMAEYLIENGADVNIHDGYETPLAIAIREHKNEIVRLLIRHNANVNIAAANGQTIMAAAIQDNNFELTEILINAGADVSVTINNVGSLLHWALLGSDGPEIISLLLDAGVDINFVNENGETAMDVFSNIRNAHILIEQHVIKLKAANLYLIDKCLDAVKDDQFNGFYGECLDEIDFLKTQWFSWKLSFYDVLHSCVNKISRRIRYISRDDIILDQKSLRSKFKLYGGIIYYRLLKAEPRKKLLVRADKIISDLFDHLPQDIHVQDILDFFSDVELKILCGLN
ncbi:ankyrin repeat and KH domain-containing protein mask-like isoform X2 [Microplitis mediator]|uniref:ankyrin repeat and KH domain-containing protein mask-like isoform X2 n=1 Tax=Microplitis mediator TaxID=375433 RepID=UPI0025524B20|nr:ankyrin repeat and KH domain-containing protein mask-like isoform X2 [Microplitis mediator]